MDQPAAQGGLAFWEPHTKPASCTGCRRAATGRGFVPGFGDPGAELLIIGEQPGEREVGAGQPFVHKSGEVLTRGLGGTRVGTYITNVRKCLGDDADDHSAAYCVGAYLMPEVARLPRARAALLVGADATEAVMGRAGVATLHGTVWTRTEAEAMRGGPVPLPPSVHTIVCSLHPAFAMRGMPQVFPTITKAIGLAKRWACSPDPPRRPTAPVLEPTPDSLHAYLSEHKVVAVDVETPRDSPNVISLCAVSGDGGGAVAFPWQEGFIDVMREFLARTDVVKVGHNFAFDQHAFGAYGIEVAWPVVDTIHVAALLWPPFKDAEGGKASVPLAWFSLAALAARVLDDAPNWKRPELPTTQAFYRAAWPEVADWLHPRLYNALDAYYTRLVWQRLRGLLDREGMLRLFQQVVAPAGATLTKMEGRGLLLDEVLTARLRRETEERAAALTTKIREEAAGFQGKLVARLTRELAETAVAARQMTPGFEKRCYQHPDYLGETRRRKCAGCAEVYLLAGPWREATQQARWKVTGLQADIKQAAQPFDAGSPDWWRGLLFDAGWGLGLKPTEFTTKTRKPSVDDDAMERLTKRYPNVELLRLRSDLSHTQRRLTTVLAVEPGPDGRVHFSYSLHRTSNGRVASGMDEGEPDKVRQSAGGNAQNIPDRDRAIYCAPLGAWLLEADWKQVELLVMAWLAKEIKLLRAFYGGEDIHSLNAAAIYGCAPDQAKSFMVRFEGQERPARHAAKRATHGWDYGLGDWKFSRMYGVSIGEARRARLAYFAAWPRLAAFQDEVLAKVARDHYLVNPFGRKLRFYGGVERVREEALAFLPASTVGDMAKAVLPKLDALPGGRLLTMTHDSFLWETQEPETMRAAAAPILEAEWLELGALPEFGLMRTKADYMVGRNWGKAGPENPAGLRGA